MQHRARSTCNRAGNSTPASAACSLLHLHLCTHQPTHTPVHTSTHLYMYVCKHTQTHHKRYKHNMHHTQPGKNNEHTTKEDTSRNTPMPQMRQHVRIPQHQQQQRKVDNNMRIMRVDRLNMKRHNTPKQGAKPPAGGTTATAVAKKNTIYATKKTQHNITPQTANHTHTRKTNNNEGNTMTMTMHHGHKCDNMQSSECRRTYSKGECGSLPYCEQCTIFRNLQYEELQTL